MKSHYSDAKMYPFNHGNDVACSFSADTGENMNMVLKREGLHPSARVCARVGWPLHHKAAGTETSCC